MSNADLTAQLDALAADVAALKQDLDRSEDMATLPMAEALVKAVRLNTSFGKFGEQVRKSIMPLFGKNGGDDQGDDKPKPKRPRK